MATIGKLGKYEIRRELGQGSMGVVYEGYDPLIERIVALKTIRSDQLASEDSADLIARFRREAQAAGRLTHPNIVSIYEFGEDGGVWFIAMEFVKGRALKDCFDANERFTSADTVRIMLQILDALGYSHRQGVIHRDIKPANIILLPDGSVKVADFGIAHIESSEFTQLGTVLGTPSYMSPEQILGLPVDGRADLFSAGVILYQFLTGERPFAGSATTTVQKVLKEDPLPPSTLNVQVSTALDAVTRRALAKRPEERFQNAQEFAAALRAAADAASAAATDPTLVAGPNAPTIGTIDAPTAKDDAGARLASPGAGVARAAPPKGTRTTAVAVVAGVVAVALGAAAWLAMQRPTGDGARLASDQGSRPVVAGTPAVSPSGPPLTVSSPVAAKAEPGTMVISAVGLIDPSDPRYRGDESLRQSALRADSRSQLVEKALGLFLDANSVAKNYDLLNARLLANSGSFITRVVQESEPRIGKDGLLSITTQAVVNVKAVQNSLNRMSRDERVEFIRAIGDPKVSVRISTRFADQPDASPRPSPVAENVIKAHIKSFGFRTWSEEDPAADESRKGADFAVQGEVTMKKLSMRLEASGVVITKFALTSWTIKCIDRETGEEIYYNTTLPKGVDSWASEEQALKGIGAKIADEFSRGFFLQHLILAGQTIVLSVEGMPDAVSGDLLGRELVGLPAVITATPRPPSSPRVYDLKLAGSGAGSDLVATGVLKPLNAKLGQTCFSLGAITGDRISVVFDQRCSDPTVLSRLETNPPAGLYGAPPGRQKAVARNPETLRKLTI